APPPRVRGVDASTRGRPDARHRGGHERLMGPNAVGSVDRRRRVRQVGHDDHRRIRSVSGKDWRGHRTVGPRRYLRPGSRLPRRLVPLAHARVVALVVSVGALYSTTLTAILAGFR